LFLNKIQTVQEAQQPFPMFWLNFCRHLSNIIFSCNVIYFKLKKKIIVTFPYLCFLRNAVSRTRTRTRIGYCTHTRATQVLNN